MLPEKSMQKMMRESSVDAVVELLATDAGSNMYVTSGFMGISSDTTSTGLRSPQNSHFQVYTYNIRIYKWHQHQ